MRILHVVHHYPPELHGGTQSYVASLARSQHAAGHDVHVVAGAAVGAPGGDVRTAVEDGVSVTRVIRDLPSEALSGQVGSERIGGWLSQYAAELAPDVAHVHHWSTLSDDVVRRLRSAGVPVALTLHDLYTSCARYFRMPDARRFCDAEVGFDDCARCVEPDTGGLGAAELEPILRRRFESFQAELAAAGRVLALCQAQIELFASLPGFAFEDFELCPIGISAHGLQEARDWRPVPERLRIGNWAGLDPRKGTHQLLEAVRGSSDRDAMEVHLWGRPAAPGYMQELESLAEGCSVFFHGEFRDEEKQNFGTLADVAVFPFLAFETHGIVVDEALRLGLPVVVPDHGAPRERVAGKGFAFASGDVAGLRSSLEWLLDQPEEVERMRAATAQLTSLEEHAERVLQLYGELIAAP